MFNSLSIRRILVLITIDYHTKYHTKITDFLFSIISSIKFQRPKYHNIKKQSVKKKH